MLHLTQVTLEQVLTPVGIFAHGILYKRQIRTADQIGIGQAFGEGFLHPIGTTMIYLKKPYFCDYQIRIIEYPGRKPLSVPFVDLPTGNGFHIGIGIGMPQMLDIGTCIFGDGNPVVLPSESSSECGFAGRLRTQKDDTH